MGISSDFLDGIRRCRKHYAQNKSLKNEQIRQRFRKTLRMVESGMYIAVINNEFEYTRHYLNIKENHHGRKNY